MVSSPIITSYGTCKKIYVPNGLYSLAHRQAIIEKSFDTEAITGV